MTNNIIYRCITLPKLLNQHIPFSTKLVYPWEKITGWFSLQIHLLKLAHSRTQVFCLPLVMLVMYIINTNKTCTITFKVVTLNCTGFRGWWHCWGGRIFVSRPGWPWPRWWRWWGLWLNDMPEKTNKLNSYNQQMIFSVILPLFAWELRALSHTIKFLLCLWRWSRIRKKCV